MPQEVDVKTVTLAASGSACMIVGMFIMVHHKLNMQGRIDWLEAPQVLAPLCITVGTILLFLTLFMWLLVNIS